MRKILILSFMLSSVSGFSQARNIELNDIWNTRTFYPKTVSGFVNLKDGKSYCVLSQDEAENTTIQQYNYITGSVTGILVDGKKIGAALGIVPFKFSSFQFSSDESKVLIEYEAESIYRHSTRARAIVVNLPDHKITSVAEGKVRYPSFDPSGNRIAYVSGNDLYIMDMLKGKTKRITKDGENNAIINGAVDWVYEEEFSMSQGYQWNSDGTYIAYYKFDETRVKEWSITMYGDLYPHLEKYKYPKAGEQNSIVDVYVCNALKGKSKKIELGSENDQYLPRIKWTKSPNVLSVQRMNRLQNKWEMLLVETAKGMVTLSLDESDDRYIEVNDNIHFLNDKQHMIVLSETSGNNHLYFHKVAGPQVFQITKGNWDVDQILAIDEKNELIYFTSTEVSVVERHIYVVSFDGKSKKRLTIQNGWHSAQFSSDMSLILHRWSHMEQGFTFTLRNTDWTELRLVEGNEEFRDKLNDFILSPVEFGKIKTERGDELNYWMIKPKNFDPVKEYPMLMYVYGGPGSQTVTMNFMYSNYFWYQMLANKHGYIVVSVDNRGTGGRGAEFKKMTYKQLGKYETEDQISAAKIFADMPFIDSSRIGIWGWSYGGYMSSLCLAKGNNVFKMAIAIAPVSNWRYYDNIYTERYMQRPQENSSGYDDNSPINFVKDIKGKYLIVHGTGDDNVHVQNSVMMVNELIKHNIPFDSEFYPNRNHGIYGGTTRLHLYTKMTDFLLENL